VRLEPRPAVVVGGVDVPGLIMVYYAAKTLYGGDPVSTGRVEVGLRVVDPRWPRKKRGKKVIANNDYALAA